MGSIGDRIKEVREKRKLSVDDLVKETGIPRNTIYRYERGETKSIPVDSLNKIADALRVSREYLDGTASDSETGLLGTQEWALSRVQMFLKNYGLILYVLSLSEGIDEDANSTLYNLAGDAIDVDAAKRIDLLLALTKEANSFVARGGKDGINDDYDRLDEHGKSVVDAVLRLEQERISAESKGAL